MTDSALAAPRTDAQAILSRARDYPYDAPSDSFLFDIDSGEVRSLDPNQAVFAGRHAVLAISSNRSPVQLRRKFTEQAGPRGVIPVIAVKIVDFDVVYSCEIASYGIFLATLAPSAGTTIGVHVTLLNDDQLSHMDGTANVGSEYDRISILPEHVLSPIALPDAPVAYTARSGPILLAGAPIAIKAIPATARRFPALTSAEILDHAARLEGCPPDDLIFLLTRDAAFRASLRARVITAGLSGPAHHDGSQSC